ARARRQSRHREALLRSASCAEVQGQEPEQVPELTPLTPTADGGTACFSRKMQEANKVRRGTEHNIHVVQNRIKYMQREEEKIWRELDGAKRQMTRIEEGRSRLLERKLCEGALRLERDSTMERNRSRALSHRDEASEQKRRAQFEAMRSKQVAGMQQREASQELLRKRQLEADKARSAARDRAAAVQREYEQGRRRLEIERHELFWDPKLDGIYKFLKDTRLPPNSVWQGGYGKSLAQPPGDIKGGKGHSFGYVDPVAKGGKPAGQTPLSEPKLSMEEYQQMATFCEKLGDLEGAKRARVAAQALAPRPQHHEPLQVQLSRAHGHARSVEKKLEAAVLKFESIEEQLEAQKSHVLSLREELAAAEKQHSALFHRLHSEYVDGPSAERAKLTIDDMLDDTKLEAWLDLSAESLFHMGELEFELSESDKQELQSRATQLREGITAMAANLFKESKSKVEAIKVEHQAHLQRLKDENEKKRKTNAGAAVTVPAASGPVVGPGKGNAAPAGGEDVQAANAWCIKRGWKSLWSEAEKTEADTSAGAALDKVKKQDFWGAHKLLGPLYQAWADRAESDLVPILGAELLKKGCRGSGPQLVWRSLLTADGRSKYPEHRAIRWLAAQWHALVLARRAGDLRLSDKLGLLLCQPPTLIAQHMGSRTQIFYRAARIAGASDQTIEVIEEFELELKDELEAANKFFAKQGGRSELGISGQSPSLVATNVPSASPRVVRAPGDENEATGVACQGAHHRALPDSAFQRALSYTPRCSASRPDPELRAPHHSTSPAPNKAERGRGAAKCSVPVGLDSRQPSWPDGCATQPARGSPARSAYRAPLVRPAGDPPGGSAVWRQGAQAPSRREEGRARPPGSPPAGPMAGALRRGGYLALGAAGAAAAAGGPRRGGGGSERRWSTPWQTGGLAGHERPAALCCGGATAKPRFVREGDFTPRMMEIASEVDFRSMLTEGSFLFEGVAGNIIERLGFGDKVFVTKGTTLIEAGADNSDVFVVGHGLLSVWVGGVRVASVGPGQVIGLYTLLKKTHASASVRVDSEVAYVLVLRHSYFMSCFEGSLEVVERIRGSPERAGACSWFRPRRPARSRYMFAPGAV
ncbi:unnamed protein product, partial [Prorocentrum cordatum]